MVSKVNIKKEKVVKNKCWDRNLSPFITIITPVYNRRATIRRTIDSVEKQKFRNIEYIIVDDGSSEPVDDIIKKFMDSTKLPVMFIKKTNGGVHTARNIGYRYGRGELVLCVDSDDELLPESCWIFHDTWLSIPEKERKEYWQIKAQLAYQDGKNVGTLFPDDINELPADESRKYFSLSKGDQVGCRVMAVMKKNLFPEPKDVTFVTENIRWVPLENKYRSWGINDVTGIVHRENNDGLNHLSNRSKWVKTKQDLRNSFWNAMYKLNESKLFCLSFLQRLELILKYCVIAHILKRNDNREFVKRHKLRGVFNNFWGVIVWLPSLLISFFVNKKKNI